MAHESSTKTDDGIGERVSARLGDLRDLTAGALSSDDSPAFRELGRVRHRLDDVEATLLDKLATLGTQQAELVDELHASSKRTTLPRKLFWLAMGGAAAALATWLADPERGKARRTELSDKVGSQARELGEQARTQAEHLGEQARTQAEQVVNKARGTVAEAGRDAMAEVDVPQDPQVLRQRIKSQVLGHRDDVDNVVLTVGQPGEVTLKGTIQSAYAEEQLVNSVREVNGVTKVDSELMIAGTN